MFCKFCGKELQDGEVCGCAGSQQAAAAQAQQTSGAAQAATDQMSSQVNAGQADAAGAQGTQFNTAQMQQKANEYMQQGMEAAGNAWKNLLGIFKSPAQEGRAYVAESDSDCVTGSHCRLVRINLHHQNQCSFFRDYFIFFIE